MRIRVAKQASKDAALDLIHAVVAKGQKARETIGGIPMDWRPKGSGRVGTLYLLKANEWRVPMSTDGDDFGYQIDRPVFEVHLTFAPFVYGETNATAEASFDEPLNSMEVAVGGDVRTPGTLGDRRRRIAGPQAAGDRPGEP